MNTLKTPESQADSAVSCRELTIPELVAEVYDEAPVMEDRARLLQPMLAALGTLSLAGVAGGLFSWLRLTSAAGETKASLDVLGRIRSSHVLALAEKVQLVDPEMMSGLASVLQSSPSLCATAAAAVLMTTLAHATQRLGGAR